MARPTHVLLATAFIYLCTCLSPTASSPAFLKPEGSYSPKKEEAIKRVDELLNQFLEELATSIGKKQKPLSEEDASHDSEEPHTGEMLEPLPPRPAPVKPSKAEGSSEGSSHEGHVTQPANGPVNNGRIIFPSD